MGHHGFQNILFLGSVLDTFLKNISTKSVYFQHTFIDDTCVCKKAINICSAFFEHVYNFVIYYVIVHLVKENVWLCYEALKISTPRPYESTIGVRILMENSVHTSNFWLERLAR